MHLETDFILKTNNKKANLSKKILSIEQRLNKYISEQLSFNILVYTIMENLTERNTTQDKAEFNYGAKHPPEPN